MLYKPVFWILKKIFRYFVYPIYTFGHRLKRRWQKSFSPAKNKFLYPFVAKPLIHVVMAILIFSVTAVNLHARTLPNTGGEGSILFSIISSGEDFELIEETAEQMNQTVVTSYLGSAYGVGQRQVTTSESLIPVSDSLALVTTGGSAITASPSVSGAVRDTTTPRRTRTRAELYTVQGGDTISTIAYSFGLSSSTILWANDLGTRDYIKPGQELKILPVDGVGHTIKSGDTLSKLAKKYSVDEEDIRKYNKLDEEDSLVVDQELLIPDGTPPRSAPAPRLARTPSLGNIKSVFNMPSTSPQSGQSNMIWPTSGRVITQYWGWRHTGVDIDGHYDSPIYAAESGVVEVSGWGRGYGIQAVVNHENGYKTRYAHMSVVYVSVGQRVSKGEVIGMIGTTGFSTGTHLHFEIYVNGVRKNPLLYVR